MRSDTTCAYDPLTFDTSFGGESRCFAFTRDTRYADDTVQKAPNHANQIREEDEDERCKQVEWPLLGRDVKGFRKVVVVTLYLALAIAVLNAVAFIAIFVLLLVKGNASVYPEFPLYKNTRFKECAALVPDATNCSAMAALREKDSLHSIYADLGRFYVLESRLGSYDWCQMVSCFNDYKVIPSSATNSAMGPSALGGWWVIIFTTISAIWTLKKSSPWFNPEFVPESCRGIWELGVIGWGSLIWDIAGPLTSWWAAFAFSIINPTPEPTLSLIAWITTWKLFFAVQVHPYSCILRRVPKIRRILPWIFGLMAALQWGATIYSIQSGDKKTIYESYKCLAEQIPSAPGTSTCSPTELCSKDWLFSTRAFSMPGNEAQAFPFAFFILSTTFTFAPLVLSTRALFSRDTGLFKHYFYMWSPVICLALGTALALPFPGLAYPITLGNKWNQRHADALVAFDPDCHAVHVALSPWRFYLDVNEYARALRIVRLWFGV